MHFFLKVIVWTNILFYHKSETRFTKQLFLNLFVLFSTQSSKLSRNICKLRVKLRNTTIYPTWGPISIFFLFQKHSSPLSEILDLLQRWHLKYIDEKNEGYSLSAALQVTILRTFSSFLAFLRKWVGNHFYMAKWTLIYHVILVDPLLFEDALMFYGS